MELNAAHFHLLLNHIPILGSIFGAALGGYGLLRRQDDVLRAALGVLVLAAVFALPTYLTGEPAEEVVEGLPDLTEALIEEHEEAALIGAIGCGVVGLLSLIVLIIGRSKSRRGAATIAVIAALAVSGWLAYTASLGGQIRHTELRATSSTSSTSGVFIPKPGRSGFSCTPPAFPSNATFYV